MSMPFQSKSLLRTKRTFSARNFTADGYKVNRKEGNADRSSSPLTTASVSTSPSGVQKSSRRTMSEPNSSLRPKNNTSADVRTWLLTRVCMRITHQDPLAKTTHREIASRAAIISSRIQPPRISAKINNNQALARIDTCMALRALFSQSGKYITAPQSRNVEAK